VDCGTNEGELLRLGAERYSFPVGLSERQAAGSTNQRCSVAEHKVSNRHSERAKRLLMMLWTAPPPARECHTRGCCLKLPRFVEELNVQVDRSIALNGAEAAPFCGFVQVVDLTRTAIAWRRFFGRVRPIIVSY
jgi:hypothetical protein